ncbi:MAG: helix-turn-helix transcriptional regulator [Clostridia bacterium]|nr:helix-turn-helix transcriptional regulator [Clostridia bacterium]
MIDNRAVGKTIATLRQNRNMTQQQLAAALNVSHQAVSKWENGAALPDVQTLMDLTHLFGITMEQLLNGEVPEDRLNGKASEDPLQSIGNFFNNIVTGIFQPAKKVDDDTSEDDGASDPVTEEVVDEADQEEECKDTEEARTPLNLQNLLQMAPFMSKAVVDALLLEHKDELTSADIARFAPFISRDCLEKLIQNPETEITWDTLQRIAPFLKREMVDKLAEIAAKGTRFAQSVADANRKSPDDIGKTIEDVSRTIGKGLDKAYRKAAKLGEGVAAEVTNAFNNIVESAKGNAARVEALRKAAQERALQDEKWDWLAEHIDEVKDEELRRSIAQKANSLGMHDWVMEHLNGYADTRTIDAAIESGNWSWLGDHAWQFEDAFQEKIALAAAKAENWQWLSIYAEQISLENCADRIAIAAYDAQARVLALQLAEHCMTEAQCEALANAAVAAEDYAFLKQLGDQLSDAYFGRLCLARAQEKRWDVVEEFIGMADDKSVQQMMELAIGEGNFDAIDMLNPHL